MLQRNIALVVRCCIGLLMAVVCLNPLESKAEPTRNMPFSCIVTNQSADKLADWLVREDTNGACDVVRVSRKDFVEAVNLDRVASGVSPFVDGAALAEAVRKATPVPYATYGETLRWRSVADDGTYPLEKARVARADEEVIDIGGVLISLSCYNMTSVPLTEDAVAPVIYPQIPLKHKKPLKRLKRIQGL